MKKALVLVISIILSLYANISFAAEYTRVIGRLISVNLKDATAEINVQSKVCRGLHTFSIQNDKALESLKPQSEVALYLVKDCKEAIIGE